MQIRRGDSMATRSRPGARVRRTVADRSRSVPAACLMNQAQSMALEAQANGEMTVASLRTLLRGLATIDAPKTVIFVSEGFPVEDQRSAVLELGTLAGLAQNQSLHAAARQPAVRHRRSAAARSRRWPIARCARRARDAGRGRARLDVQHHRQRRRRLRADRVRAVGLLPARHRIADPTDKDGSGASDPRRGRAARRDRAVAPDSEGRRHCRRAARSPREAVAAALGTPLLVSALPLRVATFSLRGPESGKIQLLIHADIGTDYTAVAPRSRSATSSPIATAGSSTARPPTRACRRS